MPSTSVSLALNAVNFPLTYAQANRAVIVKEDAALHPPYYFYGAGINRDFGIPQLIFCENVMPCDKGIFSVGFVKQVDAIGGGFIGVDQCITIRDAAEKLFSYIPAAGANYVYTQATASWASVNPFTFGSSLISTAYVDGRTFICFERDRVIEYNSATGLFTTLALTLPAGYTMAQIRGICGASNYLILHTDFEILWNAPGILTEFANLDAGAGKETPIDVRAQIMCIKPIAGGCIVYTARNAIGATFTSDATSPFSFKEIGNAGGVLSPEYVSDSDQGGNAQYIWGTNGLQRIALSGSTVEYPEVTDFLTGKQMEMWNASTKTVDLTQSAAHLKVKITFVAGRYLVVSYGQNTTYYDYALVYDTALARWGKLRIQHQDSFMYPYPQGVGMYNYNELPGFYADLPGDYASLGGLTFNAIPPKQGLAFINSLGEIYVAVLDFAQTSAAGVIILGHLQHRLNSLVTLTRVDFDGIRSAITPVVSALPSLNGKGRTSVVTASNQTASAEWQRFNVRATGQNVDIAVEGSFVMTDATVWVMENGNR